MVSPLTKGSSLGKKFYTTISGNKRKVVSGKKYYSRSKRKGVHSEYSPSRDAKVKARKRPSGAGYAKKNPRYAHAGDSDRKKRV